MKRLLCVLLAAVALAVMTSAACASIEYAGTPGGASYKYNNPGGSVGTEFTSNIDASVIELGIFDYAGDGLFASHEVGLYDVASSSWIADVVIPAGTAATLQDGYRWMSVTAPIVAGGQYILAAEYHDSGKDWFMDRATIDPAFTLTRDLYIDNPTGLAVPTTTYFNDGVRGWFGPNLKITTPEPATIIVWSLLGGLAIAIGWRRR